MLFIYVKKKIAEHGLEIETNRMLEYTFDNNKVNNFILSADGRVDLEN